MRDPIFPVLLMLIVLVTVWLGISASLPDGFAKWLQGWQTFVGATVAVIAAGVAYWNTDRSLAHSENLEKHRRQQKQTALRAMLPLSLSQICNYAEQSAWALDALIVKCEHETLPINSIEANHFGPLPSDALKSLTDFMEYSDDVNVNVLASAVALIQVHNSRLQAIVRDNKGETRSRVIVRSDLENGIIDAVEIYAGASSGFQYARRRQDSLPGELELDWDDVVHSLLNIGFFDDHPRLQAIVERRRSLSSGPFQRSNSAHGLAKALKLYA